MLITDDNEQKPVETAGFLVELRAGEKTETIIGDDIDLLYEEIIEKALKIVIARAAAISVIGTLTTRMSSR